MSYTRFPGLSYGGLANLHMFRTRELLYTMDDLVHDLSGVCKILTYLFFS